MCMLFPLVLVSILFLNSSLNFLATPKPFLNQRSNLCPLYWKPGVLTTGLPGKSRFQYLLMIFTQISGSCSNWGFFFNSVTPSVFIVQHFFCKEALPWCPSYLERNRITLQQQNHSTLSPYHKGTFPSIQCQGNTLLFVLQMYYKFLSLNIP